MRRIAHYLSTKEDDLVTNSHGVIFGSDMQHVQWNTLVNKMAWLEEIHDELLAYLCYHHLEFLSLVETSMR